MSARVAVTICEGVEHTCVKLPGTPRLEDDEVFNPSKLDYDIDRLISVNERGTRGVS